jgi:PKD repeat protein
MTIKINEWERVVESASWDSRRLHRCVYANGYVYLCGGVQDSTSTYYNDVWRSVDGITWTRLTANAGWSQRSGHGFIYFGGKLWVIGGAYYDGVNTTFYNDVWSSVDGTTWTEEAAGSPWNERHEFALCEHGSSMWLVGGYNDSVGTYNDVWVTSDGINWTNKANMPNYERELAAISFLGKLFILGGDPFTNNVYSTTDGSSWSYEGPAAWSARREHQVMRIDSESKLIVVGGTNQAGETLNDVWVSSDGSLWEEVVQTNLFPARYDYAFANSQTRAYLIGGSDESGTYDDVWVSDISDTSNFYAEPTVASEDEAVSFYDTSSGSPVAWYWNFGDGQFSHEQNPVHSYKAGLYTVTLRTTNGSGESFTKTRTNYISVYAGVSQLISSKPDMCFKLAVKESQGQGLTPITGKWVWPALVASTVKGISKLNENITLVLDSETMQFYRIGVPELWEDRAGDYDATEIACTAMFPEINSRAGVHENVRHVESHVAIRPYDEEKYRGADGYNADGLKDGQEISLEVYKNGEQLVPESALARLNKDGDYAFLKDIEAKRIQLKLKLTASAFRVTSMEIFCNEIAKRTPPQINNTPQKQYQREYALPVFWLSNNKPTAYTDRATGNVMSGILEAVTGPDLKLSAVYGSASIEFAYLIADFSISFWCDSDTTFAFNDFTVSIVDDELTGFGLTVALTSGWKYITIVRGDLLIHVYENGLLKASVSVSVVTFGEVVDIEGTLFDVRVFASALSDSAIAYYYSNYPEFIP